MLFKKIIKKLMKNKPTKVPLILQLEPQECGAACLAMIFAYYEKWISLEHLRSLCCNSKNCSTAKNIIAAAKTHNLMATGYSLSLEELKNNKFMPCIVHWQFNSFLVLKGFKKNRAFVNDPAKGAYSIPMQEFDFNFTGICLIFKPSKNFKPSGKPKNLIKFAIKRLKKTLYAIIFVAVTTIMVSLIEIVEPIFKKIYLDQILTNKNSNWLTAFIATAAIFGIIKIAVEWIKTIYSIKIKGKLAVTGSSEFMWKILNLPISFFSKRMVGDIQQQQQANEKIAEKLTNIFVPFLINFTMIFIYLAIMIKYSPILTTIGVFSIIVNIVVSNTVTKKRSTITKLKMKNSSKLAGITVAGYETIDTIKALGAEDYFFKLWANCQAKINNEFVKYEKIDNWLNLLSKLISSICSALIVLVGAYLIIKKNFELGMIVAFNGFIKLLAKPTTNLIKTSQSIQELKTEIERIEDIMQYENDEVNFKLTNKKDYKNSNFPKYFGNIKIENLTFGYSKLNEPIIKNFNLTINSGEIVVMVGKSGCGKYTISKLISGLYTPWNGNILFDGKKINELEKSIFKSYLAIVDCDDFLFEDTIANNIKMWKNEIKDLEIINAAEDAQIHSDIMKLGGYNFIIKSQGKNLSKSQRQRIEIARALAQNPKILILDEATSALDSKTENAIINSIKKRKITLIIITHKAIKLKSKFKLAVLSGGRIFEKILNYNNP